MNTTKANTTTNNVAKQEAYRIVVRGTNAKGAYKRRVKVVNGTYEQACKVASDNANKMMAGLKNIFCNVIHGKGGGMFGQE